MPKPESLLERIVKVSSVLAAAVPVAGGPTSVSLGYWLQDQEKVRWKVYWDGVEERVQSLDMKKLDKTFLESPEFILRLQEIYAEVTRTADDGKLGYLRDFLLSSLWKEGADIEWRNLFWDHVRRLSGAHLATLEFVFKRQRHLSYVQRFNLPQAGDDAPLNLDHFATAFTRFDRNLLQMILADLTAAGLIGLWHQQSAKVTAWSLTDAGLALMSFLDREWRGRDGQGREGAGKGKSGVES